jgi:hypothetical protein
VVGRVIERVFLKKYGLSGFFVGFEPPCSCLPLATVPIQARIMGNLHILVVRPSLTLQTDLWTCARRRVPLHTPSLIPYWQSTQCKSWWRYSYPETPAAVPPRTCFPLTYPASRAPCSSYTSPRHPQILCIHTDSDSTFRRSCNKPYPARRA